MSSRRLFQAIAEQIAQLIDEGRFPPGTRLPGERELAKRLGVSRVTIREAEIALQAVGRLEIKTGSGVYVSERQPARGATLPSVCAFEVTEARLLVESEAAALAARYITDADLERLTELIEQMRTGDHDAANEADRQFHKTLAKASKNAALEHAIQLFWRMREEIPDVKVTYEAVCVDDAECRAEEHRAVLRALKDRDPAAARTAMRSHFHRLIDAMLDATEKKALEEVQQKALASRARFLAAAKTG